MYVEGFDFWLFQVCPNEESPPDNWSFLEKFLNALEFSSDDHIDDDIGNKVRVDFVNSILKEYQKVIQQKNQANPNYGIWVEQDNTPFQFAGALHATSKWLCQKKINISKC